MADIENDWIDFAEKSLDRLNSAGGDWESLDEVDRELAALWRLETDMNNGGFIQFFCNWGLDCYKLAAQALKKINALEALAIIEEAFSILDTVRIQAGDKIKEYWDIPKYLQASQIERLDQLDQRYWDYPNDISTLGLKYYRK